MSIAIGLLTNGARERPFALSLSKGSDFSAGLASLELIKDRKGMPTAILARFGKLLFPDSLETKIQKFSRKGAKLAKKGREEVRDGAEGTEIITSNDPALLCELRVLARDSLFLVLACGDIESPSSAKRFLSTFCNRRGGVLGSRRTGKSSFPRNGTLA